MFLGRFVRGATVLSARNYGSGQRLKNPPASEQRGSALVAVMGVMAVGVILTTVLLASLVSGIGFTSSTRAGVQSQASADAGIAVAQMSLIKGTCTTDTVGQGNANGRFVSDVDSPLIFDVQVQYSSGAGSAIDGCPPGTNVDVQIVSGGTAAAPGVSIERGDNSTVVAEFSAASGSSTDPATGPAVFAYSSTGFTGSGSLVSVDGSTPSVMVKSGNTACGGGSDGGVDWVIEGGSLTMSGSCQIEGTVWATGTVTNNAGTSPAIGGNVVAAAYSAGNSGTVEGSVWSSGLTSLSNGGARVKGNVVAGSVSITGGDVDGSVWTSGALSFSGGGNVITGNTESGTLTMSSSATTQGSSLVLGAANLNRATINGNLKAKSITIKSSTVGGTQTIVPAGPPAGPAPATAPPAPIVPNWIDFTYKKSDWAGFSEIVLTGNCAHQWWPVGNKLQEAIDSMTGPTAIDTRGCTNGVQMDSSVQYTLNHDVAIIGENFDLTGGAKLNATKDVRLWLISEDKTPNSLPTCAGRTFTVDGGFTITNNISTMIYTPCRANLGSTKWKGQLFAGEAYLDGAAELAFTPVGLPGYDLATGVATGVTTPSTESIFEQPTSIRNTSTSD
jgi:hypothetical protein